MKILAFAQFGGMEGGANRSFLMVLDCLKNMFGHEIKVVTPNKGLFNEGLDKLDIANVIVPYHSISGVKNWSPKNIIRWLRFHWWKRRDVKKAGKWIKSLRKEGYDLVYINDTDIYFAASVAKLLKIPYVWHFRSFVDPKMHFIIGAKKMFFDCAQIIAISHGMEKTLLENAVMPSDKITVIHNGIPLLKENKLSAQSRENGLRVLHCGSITPKKGHRDALGALKILKEKGISDIYLHIVGPVTSSGDAEYLKELERFVEKSGLSEQVVFEGPCDDMASFRKNMNIELMCSVNEAFGRVTLEGMRSGLLIIGSNTGGTPEIITDKHTGLLYQQGNPADLAEKILKAYKDEGYVKQLANNAVNFSLNHFTPEQNVTSIERVLQNAANQRR